MPRRRCSPTWSPATGVPFCWRPRLSSSTCAVTMLRLLALRWALTTKPPHRASFAVGAYGRWPQLCRQHATPDAVLGHDRPSRRCRPAAAFAQSGHGTHACTHGPRCAAGRSGNGCRALLRRRLPARSQERRRGSRVRAVECLCERLGPSRHGRACEAADLMAEVLVDNFRRALARYVCAASRRLRTACSSCCRPWRTMGERSLCCLPASRRQCARTWLPPLMPAVCCLRPRRWGRVPPRPRLPPSLPLSLPL